MVLELQLAVGYLRSLHPAKNDCCPVSNTKAKTFAAMAIGIIRRYDVRKAATPLNTVSIKKNVG